MDVEYCRFKIKEFVNTNLNNKNFLDKILIEVKKNKLSAYRHQK